MQVPVSASGFNTHHLVRVPTPTLTPPHKQPHLDCHLWPEIANRAEHESLRDLAAEYNVSHETIRAVMKRVAGDRQAPAAD